MCGLTNPRSDLASALMLPTLTCPACGEQAVLAVLDSDPLVVTMRRHDGGFAITADNGEIELPIHDCGRRSSSPGTRQREWTAQASNTKPTATTPRSDARNRN